MVARKDCSYRHVIIARALWLLLLFTPEYVKSEEQYAVSLLGQIPGYMQELTLHGAVDLNNSGQVVGLAYRVPFFGTTSSFKAILFNDGDIRGFVADVETGVKDIGDLGGPASAALAINSHGVVAGWSTTPGPFWSPFSLDESLVGILLEGKELQDVPFPVVLDINDHGERVVMDPTTMDFRDHRINNAGQRLSMGFDSYPMVNSAFWSPPGVKPIPNSSVPDDPGMRCELLPYGFEGEHCKAYFKDEGDWIDIGNLGGSWTTAFDFNDRGQVVGASTLANDNSTTHDGPIRPFLWEPGQGMKDLLATAIHLPADEDSRNLLLNGHARAVSINNNGVVLFHAVPEPEKFAATRDRDGEGYFLWRAGEITRVDPWNGSRRFELSAVNDLDQLAGFAAPSGAEYTAEWYVLLLTPTALSADLSVTINGATSASTGIPYSFSVLVGNNGPQATRGTVRLRLPRDFAVSMPQGCARSEPLRSEIECAIEQLEINKNVMLPFSVIPESSEVLPVHVEVSSTTADNKGNNDRANLTVTLTTPIQTPIANDRVLSLAPEQVLDVGNVVSHWFASPYPSRPLYTRDLDLKGDMLAVVGMEKVDFELLSRFKLFQRDGNMWRERILENTGGADPTWQSLGPVTSNGGLNPATTLNVTLSSFPPPTTGYYEPTPSIYGSWVSLDSTVSAIGAGGFSLATTGNTRYVSGAPDSSGGGLEKGTVTINDSKFTLPDLSLERTLLRINAHDGGAGDFFGFSVAAYGNLVVVGAPGDDDRGSASGSAYVFEKLNNNWVQQSKLTASDGAPYDWFGYAVAVQKDMIIIGAPLNDNVDVNAGALYVFGRQNGHWIEQAKLLPVDLPLRPFSPFSTPPDTGTQFGASIDISGNWLVTSGAIVSGRPYYPGNVYLFHREANRWSEAIRISDKSVNTWDQFVKGHTVALWGDRLAVRYADQARIYRLPDTDYATDLIVSHKVVNTTGPAETEVNIFNAGLLAAPARLRLDLETLGNPIDFLAEYAFSNESVSCEVPDGSADLECWLGELLPGSTTKLNFVVFDEYPAIPGDQFIFGKISLWPRDFDDKITAASIRGRLLNSARDPEPENNVFSLATPATISQPCKGDFDQDGDVDGSDLGVFSGQFGRTNCLNGTGCNADFDEDGDVDGIDLGAFSSSFGRSDCPA